MKVLDGKVASDAASPAMVRMVEELAAMVRAGQVQSLGFIGITAGGGVMTRFGGPQPIEMLAGATILQQRLVEAATASRHSPIMPAPPGAIPGLQQ
jgi:hypothetical protein